MLVELPPEHPPEQVQDDRGTNSDAEGPPIFAHPAGGVPVVSFRTSPGNFTVNAQLNVVPLDIGKTDTKTYCTPVSTLNVLVSVWF